jgi:hypothetical protein
MVWAVRRGIEIRLLGAIVRGGGTATSRREDLRKLNGRNARDTRRLRDHVDFASRNLLDRFEKVVDVFRYDRSSSFSDSKID